MMMINRVHHSTKVKVQAKCGYDENLACSNDRDDYKIRVEDGEDAATAAVHRFNQ